MCLFIVCFSADAQTDKTETILKDINEYNEQTFQEKLFVHTDRSAYVAGEIIWFKVYCADGMNNKLSGLSKVAYIEVLDKDQQPVLQGKIALNDGTGSGSFVIPVTVHSGNFLLRAYTNWMKNFDPEFYFHQQLTLINTVQPRIIAASKVGNSYDLQFFPEGGNLVSDLESKVAFRVTDNSGKGIDFNGAIVNERNDTILHFRPAKFGIGNFSFTPQKGKQYRAFLKAANGDVITGILPHALNSGFVLDILDTANGSVKIGIHTNTGDQYIFMVIHSRQQIKASQLLHFRDGSVNFQIEKNKLGEGISSITLFNENNQPVCERLYFRKPQQQLLINVGADKVQYATRKKVYIDVVSKDEKDKAEQADMSMSVFLIDSLPPASYHDIYRYLCMSSDLKGIIESPEYYFSDTTAEVSEATDNLMLTHGWRRFKWDEVLAGKKQAFKFLPEYEGHIVNGKIVNKYNESAGENIIAFLSAPGSLFQLYAAKSNQDGSIYFNTKNFFGSKLIVGQTKKPESDSFRFDLVSPFSESFASYKLPLFYRSQTALPDLLRRNVGMQVENVFTGEKLSLFQAAETDTFNFYGKPEVTYMLDDYTRFPTMEEVLREYVREINVRKRRNNFTLTSVTKDDFGNPDVKEPVVLLDGVPQFDNGNKISHYDPLKVKKLEVIQRRYFLGPASFEGIASFTTYNGNLEGFRLDTVSTVIDYDALQMQRNFYSPVYDTPQQYASRLPDFRSLLYWSADIQTDSAGKKQISFYTSDVAGMYAVVLQGIAKDGRSGSKVFMLDVKKEINNR